MSKPEFQYVTELHDHDVVLGRGSGPNDRQGNINFRSLCHEKKIAYIEATSRDKKGRIAEEIVATVHSRGGRFLKRLSADQAKKLDVQLKGADNAVYELADKKTILEKTKQTLRQNRADFVAKVEKEVGRKPVVGAYPIHQRKIDENNDEKQFKEEVKSNCGVTADNNTPNKIDPNPPGEPDRLESITLSALFTPGQNLGVTTDVNNIDPIPLGESCGLDSLNRPTMGRSSATMLLAALFNSSELLPILSKNQDSFYESAQSGMSIQDMSLLLCDAMDRQSSGTDMDSTTMFQSILNECSLNEDMADQLVDELVKDSKSQQGTFNLTSQQKALLLQYEQEQDRRRELEQQQPQEERQQQRQKPHQLQAQQSLRQFRLGGDNDDIAPSSVFSSLVRHYNNDGDDYDDDDDELNQLSCLHEDFFENDSDRTLRRGHKRSSLSGVDPIEPANYMDESMDISYRAARDLNQALGGSSLTTMNRVTNTSEQRTSSSSSSMITSSRRCGSFDSFNESMMSMSISDFDNPGPLPSLMREGSRGTPNEVKVRNHSGASTSLMVSDLIAESEEDFHF